ncbi:MAG: serine hydroxymethyltransferase [Candidatus Sungbacteria bacterium RIFCSPHIGHO2_02_FULL_49_12]|uniref:Serine hydroxymethyltransferase n=1 Tax=Candidatus Sungbacteria bacterium RIFCSPHIGHO2_02_FULL_49_12 TaxID=1802271 RepID=A0A1G2KSM3_9BACT|nr:MAG: serine hydroxymethyltransferase [Candidatus Sungbacteria bacterium RIFCSPHIGHO2_02_FULL_49_12]
MNQKDFEKIKRSDLALARLLRAEEFRQARSLDLIASENFASAEVRLLVGSVLMNKYSEGYPGKRYYPGNAIVDQVETLAIERAKKSFGLGKNWHANVQPYSGSPANIAVYLGLAKPGDKILGMRLAAGGHLTHGHKVNASGIFFNSVSYEVNQSTGLINYKEVERIAVKEKPRVIVSGLTAYPRRIDFRKFGAIAKKVGSYHLADISHIAGLVAAGLHPSPFLHADVVTTTTHKILRGPRGAVIFCKKELAEKIDRAVFPGLQGGPHDNTTAAVAYTFGRVATPAYRAYAKHVLENAKTLARVLIKEGFVLATGGTDNHMLLLDLKPLGISGLDAEKFLECAGIIANRNSLPGDASPFRPSGIRMGTPAITTRGMKSEDMVTIATWISRILIGGENPEKVGREIQTFLKKFPVS